MRAGLLNLQQGSFRQSHSHESLQVQKLQAEVKRLIEANGKLRRQVGDASMDVEKDTTIQKLHKDVAELEEQKTALRKQVFSARNDLNTAEDLRDYYKGEYESLEIRFASVDAEYSEFKEAVFKLLNIDATMSSKTTRELFTHLNEQGINGGQGSEKKIEELRTEIISLRTQLAATKDRPSVGVPADAMEKFMQEKLELITQYEREKNKYFQLVSEVQIYRAQSKSENQKLHEQLEETCRELEEIRQILLEMHGKFGLAISSAAVVTTKVSGFRNHECKYVLKEFEEAVEEAASFTHTRKISISSSERSGN